MADTIYLPDGTTEVIFGDPMDTLTRLVLERLGPDAERIIKKYAPDLQEQQEDLEGEMRSYTKATKVQENYAASLEETAVAAEDAQRSLAGFDEINTLNTKQDSGGGGGGGVNPSEMFETVSVEPFSFDSWGEAFSAMLDTILNEGIPKLEKGFSDFADWINGFSAKLYEMFTFPGVYEKVSELGTQIASALNGLVSQIDWVMLGAALGAGLNTALGFLVSMVFGFDWQNLGNSLAGMVNSAVSKVDWKNVGALLWSKFKIALETLAGFLIGLDMPQLAKSASNIVIGFFDSMSETLKSIDWAEIGRQIVRFITGVDWAGLFTSAASALGSLAGAVAEFIGGAISEAFTGIYDYFAGKVEECGGSITAGILKGIGDGLVGIGQWITDNIFTPFINGFKSVFGIHSPSTVMEEQGGYLMEGLMGGVRAQFDAVVSVFSGLWDRIKEVFSHISDWFRDKFSAAWQAVKDVFSSGGEVFDGIKDGILSGLKAVINALINGINKVIAVPFNGINSALRTIKGVEIMGLKPFSWIDTIDIPRIPRLAQGAVIPPNREFLAVLGDQKRGTNVEAPLETIQQALAAVMQQYGGNNVTITVKPEPGLTRYLKYELDAETMRRGGRLVRGVV